MHLEVGNRHSPDGEASSEQFQFGVVGEQMSLNVGESIQEAAIERHHQCFLFVDEVAELGEERYLHVRVQLRGRPDHHAVALVGEHFRHVFFRQKVADVAQVQVVDPLSAALECAQRRDRRLVAETGSEGRLRKRVQSRLEIVQHFLVRQKALGQSRHVRPEVRHVGEDSGADRWTGIGVWDERVEPGDLVRDRRVYALEDRIAVSFEQPVWKVVPLVCRVCGRFVQHGVEVVQRITQIGETVAQQFQAVVLRRGDRRHLRPGGDHTNLCGQAVAVLQLRRQSGHQKVDVFRERQA